MQIQFYITHLFTHIIFPISLPTQKQTYNLIECTNNDEKIPKQTFFEVAQLELFIYRKCLLRHESADDNAVL